MQDVLGRHAPSTKYLVLNMQKLGLANRLRSIADWYSVARILGRHIVISWKASLDCNIRLEDLFDSFPPHVTVLAEPLPFDGDASLAFLEESLVGANISNYIIYGPMEHTMWEAPATSFRLASRLAQYTQDVIATSYDGILTYDRVPCQHYAFKHTEALQLFRPKQQFSEVVDSLLDQYFSKQLMVAVHVRVHDNVQDWEVVPPGSGQPYAKRFGDGATIEDFRRAMFSIESHFGCKRETGFLCPVRFFVASNGPREKTELLSYFPDAIAVHCDLSRDTAEGLQCAFIEWLIISRASLILHTYGSSFAEEAAQVHMRPLLSVWDSVLVHHRNVQLPFCGSMQHAKMFGTNTIEYNFTEGTVDKRQVTGGLVSLHWCGDLFSKWGIEDVYCLRSDSDLA